MKKKLQALVLSAAAAPVLALGFMAVAPTALGQNAAAVGDYTLQTGANSAKGDGTASTLFNTNGNQGIFTTIVNIMLYVVGALAVIMLIIGGIRYVVSAGDSSAVTSAKNTILYAIIGIVVCFLAYAVVNWVLSGLGSTTT